MKEEQTISAGRTFFGHPIGLSTLFFTEMWERFSYYGMRAILILFLTASIQEGGLGINEKNAGAIYGLYTMFVYLLALPGGWLADRLFGLQKTIWYGGIIIMLGHFSMAFPSEETFFLGLIMIAIGTGLLKPNISAIVGNLYEHDTSEKRDAGFSIFYMGINLGAFIAPLIVGYLGQRVDWHIGFGMAGFGMLLGLIQYKFTSKFLGNIGLQPMQAVKKPKKLHIQLTIIVAIIGIIYLLGVMGYVNYEPSFIAKWANYILLGAVIIYFIYLYGYGKLSQREKRNVGAIALFFVFASFFWSGFEQAGSTLNLFAQRYTDLNVLGFGVPASWFQSANSVLLITFAPIFAWLWVWLGKRNLEPNTPLKFVFGLISLGIGFLVMVLASMAVVQGEKALPVWLLLTYMFHTFGELSLSPVGLSTVTKLAPAKLGGQMMGIWFISIAMGNLVAGRFAGEFDESAIDSNPQLLVDNFMLVVYITIGAGLVLLIFSKLVRHLMKPIR